MNKKTQMTTKEDKLEPQTIQQRIADVIKEIERHANHYETTGEKPSATLYSDLHTKVYNILNKRHHEPIQDNMEDKNSFAIELIYSNYVELLKNNLDKYFPASEVEKGSLEYLVKGNQEYLRFYNILHIIFQSIDKVCQEDLQLEPMCIWIFYIKVFKKYKDQLFRALCQAFTDKLQSNKDNQRIMNDFLKIVQQMNKAVENMNVVKDEDKFFEEIQQRTLVTARRLYQDQYQVWVQEGHGTYAFLEKLEHFLASQIEFINGAFESCPKLQAELLHELREIMIQQYKSTLLEVNNKEGFTVMLEYNSKVQVDNLKRVYNLYIQLNDQFSQIRQSLRTYLLMIGKKIIDDKIEEVGKRSGERTPLRLHQDDPFINKLFKLHRKYLQIINESFQENQYLRQAFKDAFEEILNKNIGEYSFAEYLVQYVSQLLESQRITDEHKIDVQYLYSFLSDKDYFVAYYQRQLAIRLLMKKTNKDDEILMVTKLEHMYDKVFIQRSGSGTVKPLFEMIAEMSNDQLNKEFTQLRSIVELKFQMDVRVLSKQCWPKFQECTMKSSIDDISTAQQLFESYYQMMPINQHRQLTWMNSLSQVVLKYKKYDLHVSIYQQNILYVYLYKNEKKTLDFFADVTGLEKPCLIKNLQALTDSNLLINEGDTYRFNEAFSSKQIKVEVKWLISYKDLEQKTLDNEREQIIEAALIKIMKKEKRIAFSTLIQRVQEYLHAFNPSIALIKEKVEKLYKLEYLSRSEQDHEMINYVG